MLMDFLWLVIGLALLTVAGDFLVRGATAIAQALHIPPLLIGLTVVGFGTSAPELVVGVKAAMEGVPALAVGNVIGSNITNTLLVLGVPAVLLPVCCNQPFIRRNTVYMLITTITIIALALTGALGTEAGVALLCLFVVYMAYTVYNISTTRQASRELVNEVECIAAQSGSLPKAAMFTLAGLVMLPLSAALTVDGATGIAASLGVSDSVVGLTIVALGTSLPELATVVAASMHRNSAMIVGNILGSNIFNATAILGATTLSSPKPIDMSTISGELWVLAGATVVLSIFVFSRMSLGRSSGVCLVTAYAAYIGAAVLQG
ncbi:calcium/sodium antiporter [Kordiimonas aestuarii]|uniref:calcium/sodium antiporter n=1 Tax=Kordiimonas aestuarii TaxID=1005925 RepID=UPI0021D0B95A|nr:calcium/sodium antiporter [Kordiimonas aestuarii]